MEQERENLASAILESLNAACGSWGITCIRYQVLMIYSSGSKKCVYHVHF